MAEDDDSPETRQARLARRKRRFRLAWGLGAVALIGAGIVASSYAFPADVAGTPTKRPVTRAGTTTTTRTPRIGDPAVIPNQKPDTHRPLSHDTPLQMWVGGDSLAGAFGPALGDLVGSTGVVKTLIDYRVSSGLVDNANRNWYQRATDQMSSAKPEAVVFIIGANDASIVNNGDRNADGTPDWELDYRSKVARMMDTFIGGDAHRTVYWIGTPTMRMTSLNRGAVELNRVIREEALKRPDDVQYVDAYKLFEGPNGGYTDLLTNESGDTIRARIPDGVHFSTDGAKHLADAVYKLIEKQWKLIEQADPTQPIKWTIVRGSGESVPGIGTQKPNVGPTTPRTTSTIGSTSPPTTVIVDDTATSAPPTSVPEDTTPTTTPPPTTSPAPTSPPTTAGPVVTTP